MKKDILVTLGKAAVAEIIVKKSRFIASTCPVDYEQEYGKYNFLRKCDIIPGIQER